MVVSILVFALLPHQLSFGYKVASRVIFIPLIAVLPMRSFGSPMKTRGKGMQIFISPVFAPADDGPRALGRQIEVALRALHEVLELEGHR